VRLRPICPVSILNTIVPLAFTACRYEDGGVGAYVAFRYHGHPRIVVPANIINPTNILLALVELTSNLKLLEIKPCCVA